MLGAHLLAAGRYPEAGERLREGAALAASAENSAEARLGEAFAALAWLLDGGTGAQQHFDDTIARLAEEDEGAALVEQVATAREVLTPSALRCPREESTRWPDMAAILGNDAGPTTGRDH